MRSAGLSECYSTGQPAPSGWSKEMQLFVYAAAPTRFEMRYIGEDQWYPVPIDDVALTLGAYHPDLQQCLNRMLDGEEVASRLALFRVSRRQRRA